MKHKILPNARVAIAMDGSNQLFIDTGNACIPVSHAPTIIDLAQLKCQTSNGEEITFNDALLGLLGASLQSSKGQYMYVTDVDGKLKVAASKSHDIQLSMFADNCTVYLPVMYAFNGMLHAAQIAGNFVIRIGDGAYINSNMNVQFIRDSDEVRLFVFATALI